MLELIRLSPLKGFLLGCAVLYALLVGTLVYRDRPSPVERTILGLLGFAAPVVLFLCAILVLGVNVPYWDDYDVFLPYLSMPAAERMRHLFDFHNEHRILTTRLAAELVRAWNGSFSFKGCMLVGNALLLQPRAAR